MTPEQRAELRAQLFLEHHYCPDSRITDRVRKYDQPHLPGDYHEWFVIGLHGAVQLHLTIPESGDVGDRYGGVETHHRECPDGWKDRIASFPNCRILNGPCWTTGSSSAIQDYLPWIKSGMTGYDHELVFNRLLDHYESVFVKEA